MRKNPTISVVVPIYNIENLIKRCVESIIKQTYNNLEIILVNDGSTDSSGEICNQLFNGDKRIKVIHKTNGGLSDARNTGIKAANGDYISFVDGDDYIEIDAYQKIVEKINKFYPEVIICNATKINTDLNKKVKLMKNKITSEKPITGLEYYVNSLKQKSMSVCAWLNICKREFILNNNLFFKEGIFHEDTHWTPRMLIRASTVLYYDFEFYNYLVREGSIMTQKDKTKNGVDIINTCYELEFLYKNIDNNEFKKVLNDNLLDLYLAAIYVGRLHRKEYSIYLKRKFVLNKIASINTLLKSILFLISPNTYYYANYISKKVKNSF